MLGLMASASSVLQLGLLRMRPLQFWLKARVPRRAWASGLLCLKVNQKCIAALKPWKANDWYRSGVSLGTSPSVRVVSTDASTSGWGALLEGRPFFGQWSEREKLLHINCLEMLAVDNALTRFCPQIRGHHVLVRSDNMSVVVYINHQGGIRSRTLHRLTERLLVWAQHNLRSLRAAHMPGHLNVGPDRLSRNNLPSRDALAHVWPRCPLYAFSPCHAPTPGVRANQEKRMPSATRRPIMDEPCLVSSPDAADEYPPWPIPAVRLFAALSLWSIKAVWPSMALPCAATKRKKRQARNKTVYDSPFSSSRSSGS
ncbi:hypothetical protein PO909_023557 [Leuciscus waleckii]